MTDRTLSYEAARALEDLPLDLLRRVVGLHAPALAARLDHAGDLWERRDALPEQLLDDVHLLFDMSDEGGQERILDALSGPLFACERAGESGVVLAARLLLVNPDLLHSLYGRRLFSRPRRFREHLCRAAFTPRDVDVRALSDRLGAFFEGRGRSPWCRVLSWLDGQTRCFIVSHGGCQRRDAAIREAGGGYCEDRVSWRPQRHDHVAFDLRTGRLRLSSLDAATTQQYLATFGAALAGDPHAFISGVVVSLEPIEDHGADYLLPTREISGIRLSELTVRTLEDTVETITFRGADVPAYFLSRAGAPSDLGALQQAKLRLQVRGERRWRTVELTLPDQVTGAWRRHAPLLERYLEDKGFVAGPAAP